MSKHTPTPWQAMEPTGDVLTKIKIRGQRHSGKWTKLATVESTSPSLAEANAEFIVKACNCHEELLAACKELLQRELEVIGMPGSGFKVDNVLVAEVRAAIAKAEGTQP